MKVEIWSDVICPFCYIGKRNFERALAQFADRDTLDIIWKSFQLDSSMPEEANESYEQYLVRRKGLSNEQVKVMLQNVTHSARQVGLDYKFDDAVMVNSHKAHCFIQFAKLHNKGNEAEERLFKAFFTDGENIADHTTLSKLGAELGFDEKTMQDVLDDHRYAIEVNRDIQEARNLGVNGVPFFVFNRKYAISGAQPSHVFFETLQKSFSEWREQNPVPQLEIQQGQSCNVDGICE